MSNDFIEPSRAKVRRFCKIIERKWSSGRQKAPGRDVPQNGEQIPGHGSWQGRRDKLRLKKSSEHGGKRWTFLGKRVEIKEGHGIWTVISWEVSEIDNWHEQWRETKGIIEAKTAYRLHTQQRSRLLFWHSVS